MYREGSVVRTHDGFVVRTDDGSVVRTDDGAVIRTVNGVGAEECGMRTLTVNCGSTNKYPWSTNSRKKQHAVQWLLTHG